MRKQLVEEFFKRTEAFVAAYEQINRDGFFGSLTVQVAGMDGYFPLVDIRGEGFLPNKPADRRSGASVLVDPVAIFEKVRAISISEDYRIRATHCEIKQDIWPKWDRRGENIIGELGQHIQFHVFVHMKWKGKGRPS